MAKGRAFQPMPSLLQQDTILASVKDEGRSLGRRVKLPFLNANAPHLQ